MLLTNKDVVTAGLFGVGFGFVLTGFPLVGGGMLLISAVLFLLR